MDYKCSQCVNYDWNNKERWVSKDRYYCNAGRGYKEPTDIACKFDFILDKSTDKDSGGFQPSGCYITTIVCNILGYSDDCEVLTTLRSFRENVLRPNKEYHNLLAEYDLIGPIISERIKNKKDNEKFCLNITHDFLIPCVNAIKNNEEEKAIELYKQMIWYLITMLNITPIEIDITNCVYDSTIIGKGRSRSIKILNEGI